MGKFIRELFGQEAVRLTEPDEHLKTIIVPLPARPRA
jgi:hypothetical protein